MFCSRMGNGIPITCTTTYQKWTGQPIHLAGSKNPLPLGMGSVKEKKQYIERVRLKVLPCFLKRKLEEGYSYIDSFEDPDDPAYRQVILEKTIR